MMRPIFHTRLAGIGMLFWVLALAALLAGTAGCRNPAYSNLPPSALSPPGTPFPELAKGDVFLDETELPSNTIIEPGDTLDIVIRRGSGEEAMTARVSKVGFTSLNVADVDVRGLTAEEAASKIQRAVEPYMRNPTVKVRIKRDKLKVKRIFVFGDVNKPGMYPMSRGMTVMEAVLAAENYKETAVLDEVRVIRGNLDRPTVLTADISRLLTYGDPAGNVQLRENDVVYIPRERLGDASVTAKKLGPILGAALAPLQAAFFTQLLVTP